MTTLRIGTRASALATTQTGHVADELRAAGHDCEIVHVTTEGDTNRASLSQIGGTGVFASALRDALKDGRIDVAVHSLKDLPTAPEPGLTIAAVTRREDPRDVLVARDGMSLHDLPHGALVGTGSPRRLAQLALARPDLRFRDLRGNVDSRINKTRTGELDAVVLARAGLSRLERLGDATDTLETDVVLPAAGQGALAVECRSDAPEVIEALACVNDADTRRCVETERRVLAILEAGCTAPIGALATTEGDQITCEAFLGPVSDVQVLTRDGAPPPGGQRARAQGHDPEALAQDIARQLLAAVPQAVPPDGIPPEPPPGHDPQNATSTPHVSPQEDSP